ncbi:hypothetical protein PG990_012526 [Apiospora arundinis]
MARKHQRPIMDPAQFAIPQYGPPYGPSNSHHQMLAPYSYHPAYSSMYMDPNGNHFFLHPLASTGDLPRAGHRHAVVKKGSMKGDAVKAQGDTTEVHQPEMQVIHAARQLYNQSEANLKSHEKLLAAYDNDTKPIRGYVHESHLLEHIWKLKVDKFQKDKPNEEQAPAAQKAKLAFCLDEMDKAAQHLLAELLSGEREHDCRTTVLEKLQQAGDRLRDLTDKASTYVNAHKDLVEELKTIKKLTDPKSSALYHIEKSEAGSQDQDQSQEGNDDDS